MMTKINTGLISRTIILFAAMMAGTFVCQSQNTFLKTLGGTRSDEMHSMIRSHDGGFIMVGSTESYGQGNLGVTDDYIVKTDSDGNILWSKTLGLQSYDDIFWIEPANDSGYVICGIASDNDISIGILLAKISESGGILWQKVLAQDQAGIGYCVRQVTDGGFIVAAEILQLDNLDFLLIKTDENGNVQWSKQVGSLEPDIPSYIMQTSDGGYLACGVTRQNSATLPLYAVKTDSLGNVTWQKTYNTSPVFSRSSVSNVIATADGGYLVAGANTHNQLFSDIILLKIDSAGAPQWIKAFGGAADEFCKSIIQEGNGNFVVCGGSASSEAGNFDALVMLIDPAGGLIQSSLFGTTYADDEFVSILPLADGGYMLGGNTSSFNQFLSSDFMMMRINKDFSGPQCDTLSPNLIETEVFFSDTTDVSESDVNVLVNDVIAVIDSGVNDSLLCDAATGVELPPPPVGDVLSFYPNPAVKDLTFNGNYNEVVRMEVYNSLGTKISSLPFSKQVNIADLTGGYYFIRFLNDVGEVLQTIRFVKQ